MSIFRKVQNLIPFIIYLVFTYLISMQLFGGVISTGDFPYFWPFSSVDSFSTWNTAFLGFDRLSTMFGQQVVALIPKFFFKLGFSHELISYIHNFGLVYICSLLYFFLAKKISGNILFAYFAGLFIIVNNFVLEHFLVFPGLIFYSLIVYGFTLYICYEIYLHGLNLKKVLSIVFLSFFHLHPFYFAINFLFLLTFFVYYSIKNFQTRYFKKILLYFVVLFLGIIAIQSYWLVPFIQNIFISSSSQVYGGDSQFAVFSGYFQSIDYVNLLNLYHYPGALGRKMHGGSLQYFFYFYLTSLIVFLLIKIKYKNTSWVIFLFFNLLFFFNLALGPKSLLTGKMWMYAYNHFSLFGFFRSFSRFIILYFVILIFLFAFLFKNWRSKYKNSVLLFTGFLLLISHSIFFSGDLGGFITSAKVPREYISVNERYFQKDSLQYNILTLPNIPYESYTWFLADQKTKSGENVNQSTYFRELFFSKPVIYNRYAVQLDLRNDFFESFFRYDENFEFSDNFNQAVDILNVKYIIVQKDLIDPLKKNTRVNVEKYLNYFNSSQDFILKEDNDSFALYENEDFYPILFTPGLSFTKKNDTKYNLFLKNFSGRQNLVFLQKFHKGWKLYLKPNSNKLCCQPIEYYENTKTTECKHTQKFFEGEELLYLWKKPIFDDTHHLVYDYANQWTIDPEYIKQNFDKSYYTENPDGSIDIELTLYFKPQSYFYLGLVISGVTFLSCLGFLGYDWRKRKREGRESALL